jgi:HK97 family phage prohead protease
MPTTPAQRRAAASVEYWRRKGDHQAARAALLGLPEADRDVVRSMIDTMNSYGATSTSELMHAMTFVPVGELVTASLATDPEPDIDQLEAEIRAAMATETLSAPPAALHPSGHHYTPAVKGVAVSGGEITGLASTYNNVDLQADMIEPGAFADTIAEVQAGRQRMPLLDWHGSSLDRVIGSVIELKDTARGLWFRARFTEDEQGQRARQLAMDGHLSGVSIGYSPLKGAVRSVGGQLVRVLSKVRVHEISLTPIPANPLAQLESAKGAEDRFAANWREEIDLERERRERRNDYDLAMKAVMDRLETK